VLGKKWRQKEMLVTATAEAINSIVTTAYEQRLDQDTIRQALATLSKTASEE
jgi:hypothetical protein